MCYRRIIFRVSIISAILSISKVYSIIQNSEMASILHRPIRALAFPPSSSVGLFFAIAVPLEAPDQSIFLSYFFESTYPLPTNYTSDFVPLIERKKRSIDRKTIYGAIENKFESAGFSGRECLLRSICETSEQPLRHNGFLGDVFHVLFTPSTSEREDLPQDIVDAELVGRNGSCLKYNLLCPMGLFDLIGTFMTE
ncbi:uncharacterized protein LOC117168141 [Belonocnema kinseyi]|uniref:uncharacterized protein LOC117168141 n=1 Tax=Belonocnema kinseyi TaxID=2817044 RepID=UPI00143D4CC1|nr:uncharacterized protein LOC117168141 [Belonocnema kinseyi]